MFFFQIYRAILISKFRVTHYFKSVIRTIIIEYNKSFAKKPTFNKKPVFFMEKTQPSGLNGYIPGYIPRPTLASTLIIIYFNNYLIVFLPLMNWIIKSGSFLKSTSLLISIKLWCFNKTLVIVF